MTTAFLRIKADTINRSQTRGFEDRLEPRACPCASMHLCIPKAGDLVRAREHMEQARHVGDH